MNSQFYFASRKLRIGNFEQIKICQNNSIYTFCKIKKLQKQFLKCKFVYIEKNENFAKSKFPPYMKL